MDLITIFGMAVGLSMDCLAVSMACGMRLGRPSAAQAVRMALAFGGAQAVMPVAGWLAGRTVVDIIKDYDHWLAFALLALVGGKMIREYFEKGEECAENARDPTKGRDLLLLSIATSIDALAVGLSLAFIKSGIAVPAAVIGVTCFAITFAGVLVGGKASDLWGRRMDLLGGLILILIGVNILAEHLGFGVR
ncbi:MAG: manganese efflux pump [Deltaproteobacteria bacterium]|nr:manganese efflux pump [Deltaproteobacteria bacterium]